MKMYMLADQVACVVKPKDMPPILVTRQSTRGVTERNEKESSTLAAYGRTCVHDAVVSEQ
jgi:hypothetical protein